MDSKRLISFVFLGFASASLAHATNSITAEQLRVFSQPQVSKSLGYKNQDKLIIIHADDVGLNDSTNNAVIRAFEQGFINSASIMVPAPKFVEFAQYAKQHPELDLGLHITFTSEWSKIKWGGVLSVDKIPSLLNNKGHFYATTADFVKHAKLAEVELEFRAQIEHAIALGIKPSHLDSHMAALFQNVDLFELYLKMAREYKIPAVIPLNFISANTQYMALLNEEDFGLDSYLFASGNTSAENWSKAYDDLIKSAKPGQVSQITLHIGYDDQDMTNTTGRENDFGAKWRQRDMDYVANPAVKTILKEQKIKLISWKKIQAMLMAK